MIRTTIDLLPFGFDVPSYVSHLARIDIANDSTGTLEVANYTYTAWNVTYDANSNVKMENAGEGEITGFERKRGAVALLAAVMMDWERKYGGNYE